MNAVLWMQKIDTILLVVITLSALIIFREDKELSLPCRLLVITLGFGCLSQATWLQSYWWPNPTAGYPWGGLMRDFGAAGLGVLRTATVLRRVQEARQLEQAQRGARLSS